MRNRNRSPTMPKLLLGILMFFSPALAFPQPLSPSLRGVGGSGANSLRRLDPVAITVGSNTAGSWP